MHESMPICNSRSLPWTGGAGAAWRGGGARDTPPLEPLTFGLYAATFPVRLDGPDLKPREEKKPDVCDWVAFLAGAGGAATPADPRTGAAGLAGGALCGPPAPPNRGAGGAGIDRAASPTIAPTLRAPLATASRMLSPPSSWLAPAP